MALEPAALVRVSGFTTNEPYFAASGANRFDAPGCPASPEFATCYFGTNLIVALAETVLHDDLPDAGFFRLARSRFVGKHVLRFAGETLILADLTGTHLKRLGGHADLSGTGDYAVAHAWSLAVHRNPGRFDGFTYMSRHINDQRAVVLFDRARASWRWRPTASCFAIQTSPPPPTTSALSCLSVCSALPDVLDRYATGPRGYPLLQTAVRYCRAGSARSRCRTRAPPKPARRWRRRCGRGWPAPPPGRCCARPRGSTTSAETCARRN